MTWISRPKGSGCSTTSVRKPTNCALVWRAAVLPSTSPVAVFNAANRLTVPLRLYSKPRSPGPPTRQWPHAVLAIEGLDGWSFVHAEHRRVRRRIQIQRDHVGRLGLEVRIVGDHVPLEPVRLEVVLAPDALHGHERQAQLGGELAAAPVRRAVLGLALERVVEHPGASSRAKSLRGARPG